MKTRVYIRKTSASLCNIQSSFPEDGHVKKKKLFYGRIALLGLVLISVEISRLHSVRHNTLGRSPLDE